MASLDSIIKIESEVRPCYVEGKKALFHKFSHEKSPIFNDEYDFAIVEYEDGKIDKVSPKKITFCDGKINQYAFRKLGDYNE